ncbi:MAG: sensor domain-containing diguanylate cyclase [Janthinobacterium lividum]
MTSPGLWEWRRSDNRLRLSQEIRRLIAHSDDVVPETAEAAIALVHPDDVASVTVAFDDVIAGRSSAIVSTHRVRHQDGGWIWILLRGQVVERDSDGYPTEIFGIAVKCDQASRLLLQDYWPQDVESFLDDAEIAAWRFDSRSNTTFRSHRSSTMLGYGPGEIGAGWPGWVALIHADDRMRVLDGVEQATREGVKTYQQEYRMLCRDGSYLWILDRVRVHAHTVDGAIDVSSGLFIDISAQVAARQALEALSVTDGLTGISNRRQFDDTLTAMWGGYERSGRPLSLLLIDIDFFKLFNDQYGHQAGDECLRILSRAMSLTLRMGLDLLARYGGEEFAVLLPDCPAAEAWQIAERIRTTIRTLEMRHEAFRIGMPLVTVSIGVATSDSRPITRPDQLVGAADKALYRAKRLGRDRSVIAFQEPEEVASDLLELDTFDSWPLPRQDTWTAQPRPR